jgi:hypothetical protein
MIFGEPKATLRIEVVKPKWYRRNLPSWEEVRDFIMLWLSLAGMLFFLYLLFK